MRNLDLPGYVKNTVEKLEKAGYKAVIVGGCIRDAVLGIEPDDWDAATSARPEDVISLFEHTVSTGVSHGTVTVLSGDGKVEVTTFRSDGEYTDSRHPENVKFVSSLEEDLKRRDFTMNAIAMEISGELYDPFGGIEDIKKRVIRCVGAAEDRFTEDALRMFRALRFSAKLGFRVDEEAEHAIYTCSGLASNISAERIRDELEKTLISDRPETVGKMIDAGLLNSFLTDKCTESFEKLGQINQNSKERWSSFTAVLLKAGAINSPYVFLRRLRLSRTEVNCCARAAENAVNMTITTVSDWKRYISVNGRDTAECASAAMEALGVEGSVKLLERVVRSGECCTLRELNITGDDLVKIGTPPGPEVGELLWKLLDYAMENPKKNIYENLLQKAESLRKNVKD